MNRKSRFSKTAIFCNAYSQRGKERKAVDGFLYTYGRVTLLSASNCLRASSCFGIEMSVSTWQGFRQKVDIYLTARKRSAEEASVEVAISLADGGDVVLDEYNTLFEVTQEPTYKLVLVNLEANSPQYLTVLILPLRHCNLEDQEEKMVRDQSIAGVACQNKPSGARSKRNFEQHRPTKQYGASRRSVFG